MLITLVSHFSEIGKKSRLKKLLRARGQGTLKRYTRTTESQKMSRFCTTN